MIGAETEKILYLIGGPMGVGKTTVGQALKQQLPNSVFLDGDWCWDAEPFQVTEETKTMVLDNICYLLNNFIHCSAYQHIIFVWVMAEQAVIDTLCARLDTAHCCVHCISLVASWEVLRARLETDISCGKRDAGVIARSEKRLPEYAALRTRKIVTDQLTVSEIAETIAAL